MCRYEGLVYIGDSSQWSSFARKIYQPARAWLMTFFPHPLQSPPRVTGVQRLPHSWLLCITAHRACIWALPKGAWDKRVPSSPSGTHRARLAPATPSGQPSPVPHSCHLHPCKWGHKAGFTGARRGTDAAEQTDVFQNLTDVQALFF